MVQLAATPQEMTSWPCISSQFHNQVKRKRELFSLHKAPRKELLEPRKKKDLLEMFSDL
jgi:hypothetical protein